MLQNVSHGQKCHIMIEAHVDVKIKMVICFIFVMVLLKKCNNQIHKTSYDQHQQVPQIQKRIDIMTQELHTNDLREVISY
jgi:hypothetical protein